MEKISLIIPCKNEVESLGAVLEEVKDNKFVDEIIVVVDNEEDNSIPITKKFNCKLIIQKNKGYGSAIIEGFKNAKNNFGCIYNADLSFDPKYFDELIKLSKNNDFIFGSGGRDSLYGESGFDVFALQSGIGEAKDFFGNFGTGLFAGNAARIYDYNEFSDKLLYSSNSFSSMEFAAVGNSNPFGFGFGIGVELGVQYNVYNDGINFGLNWATIYEDNGFLADTVLAHVTTGLLFAPAPTIDNTDCAFLIF